jgi:hypothetical protein
LIASLFSFVLAFVLGRRVEADRPPSEETEDDQE